MRAGQLGTPLTLEEPSQTVASGKATPAYTNRGKAWCRVEGLSGTDRTGIVSTAGYRVTTRYRSDVTSKWRLRDHNGTRVLEIVSAVDPDGRRRELVITAVEVVG